MNYKDKALNYLMSINENVKRNGFLDQNSAEILIQVCASDIISAETYWEQLVYACENNGEFLEVKPIYH